MSNILALREDLRRAVLDYADTRRLTAYRSVSELGTLFESIIECARAVIAAEDALCPVPPARQEESQDG